MNNQSIFNFYFILDNVMSHKKIEVLFFRLVKSNSPLRTNESVTATELLVLLIKIFL